MVLESSNPTRQIKILATLSTRCQGSEADRSDQQTWTNKVIRTVQAQLRMQISLKVSEVADQERLNTMLGNFQAKEEDQALLLTDHHLQDKAMASTSRPSTENHRIRTK